MLQNDEHNFFIKAGYKPNLNPSYYVDSKSNCIYQPHAYELAYYLATKAGVKYVIDVGGGNGEKLQKFLNKFEVVVVDYGDNFETLKRNLHNATFINFDLEQGLPEFPMEMISNAVVIFSDVIEHIKFPEQTLAALSKISYLCKFLIITTPERDRARGVGDFGPPANPCHVREWNIDEFYSLLKHYNFSRSMLGFTVNTDIHLWKNNIIALSGKYCSYKGCKPLNILSIINVYNEIDIIEEVIKHLLNQGVDIKIIDNWSDDGTYELVKNIALNEPRVSVKRFPDKANQYYEWGMLLKNVELEAQNNPKYDWVIHHDADEIRISPWRNVTLAEAVSFIDYLDFNAIDFTVVDFRPTSNTSDILRYEEELRFFEFGKRPGHFLQIKAWKNLNNIQVDLASSGGHEAIFPGRKIYPIKFITKHYPLRTQTQAHKKIFVERIKRISPEEKAKGWHTQYNNYKEDKQFIWNKDHLLNWNLNHFYTEFFVERISGIGII